MSHSSSKDTTMPITKGQKKTARADMTTGEQGGRTDADLKSALGCVQSRLTLCSPTDCRL